MQLQDCLTISLRNNADYLKKKPDQELFIMLVRESLNSLTL